MDHLLIRGGRRLQGTVQVSGSKNSALPILAACLMADGPTLLHAVPRLSDTRLMLDLLNALGCRTRRAPSEPMGNGPALNGALEVQVENELLVEAGFEAVQKMRASICVLGPLLAKRGRAVVSQPGGCSIGDRPIDLHLRGLAKLGAEFRQESGYVVATVRGRLKGCTMYLGGTQGPTVLGTINVMSAATLAEGTTRIVGAACEPEVVDCATLLNKMGARITGAGTGEITIEGVDKLKGVEHTVIPDRIEAGTFMIAAGITGSEITLANMRADHLVALTDRLEEAGIRIRETEQGVVVTPTARPKHVDVTTWPYPGFPTDLQAQLGALLATADGTSVITERVYPERFGYIGELSRMNAKVRLNGPTALIDGVDHLSGATVTCTDLRASAALVLAGLSAKGVTRVEEIHHMDRGYEKLEEKLAALGADIERVSVKPSLKVTVNRDVVPMKAVAHGAA
ncbi:MAG: UDP-N-acetylglucosamine 1-carboxyvinyltransferase [Tepidisphaeraceae bacterium]